MLSIAVIGAGRIGHVHAKTIAAHPQAELALVCDPFEDAAEKLAATYGARSCKDAEEVFADPEIAAVGLTQAHADEGGLSLDPPSILVGSAGW